MKKNILAALAMLWITSSAVAQAQRDSLPYQKYPSLPAFKLLLQDSTAIFNMYDAKAGRPIVLFFFSPDCEHCQMMTQALMNNMDSMRVADFYFFTFMPLTSLRPFAAKYHMSGYPNITVGKDYQFFFPAFYGATTVPYLVIYDRHKKLVKLYTKSVKAPELISLLRSL